MDNKKNIKTKDNKDKEDKFENLINKAKHYMDKVENYLYGDDNRYINPNDKRNASPKRNNLNNKNNHDEDKLNSLDNIDLLEYSQNLKSSITDLDEKSIVVEDKKQNNENKQMDIRNIDNFLFKIEELTIKNPKIFSQLKDNIIYLECKVPLFKMEQKIRDRDKDKDRDNKVQDSTNKNQLNVNDGLILYDTFK